MTYNVRPGGEPPMFIFNSFNQMKSNEAIAKCDFMVNNPSGQSIKKAAKIIFEIGDNPRDNLYLHKIYIGDHLIYGWWYNMN
jgi:hypothetical protein